MKVSLRPQAIAAAAAAREDSERLPGPQEDAEGVLRTTDSLLCTAWHGTARTSTSACSSLPSHPQAAAAVTHTHQRCTRSPNSLKALSANQVKSSTICGPRKPPYACCRAWGRSQWCNTSRGFMPAWRGEGGGHAHRGEASMCLLCLKCVSVCGCCSAHCYDCSDEVHNPKQHCS
jgi:hypothetical protein